MADDRGTQSTTAQPAHDRESFVSGLGQGRERFLAHVIEHGLEISRRSPDDFVRWFPPAAIMEALRERSDLRANILALTTGIKLKIALKKSPSSAGEDLQIAMDEGETDAESIVLLFHPDDRVRYLDAKRLWSYVIEGELSQLDGAQRVVPDATRRHISFMVERALVESLVTPQDIVEGLGVPRLIEHLPKAVVERLLSTALDLGRSKQPFTEERMFEVVPLATLVEHVPLHDIWQSVIVARVAERHGLVEGGAAKPQPGVAKPAAASERLRPTPRPPAFGVEPLVADPNDVHSIEEPLPPSMPLPDFDVDEDTDVGQRLQLAAARLAEQPPHRPSSVPPPKLGGPRFGEPERRMPSSAPPPARKIPGMVPKPGRK